MTGERRSAHRLGLVAAAMIVTYGVFVAVLPLLIYHEPRPPWSIYRPVALIVLFSIPATVAVIGVLRSRRSLILSAGIVCLLQSVVAFSGVTFGFAIPGILLLALAGRARRSQASRETRVSALAAIGVVALTLGAWVATLGLTEEVCWTSTTNPDQSLAYERVPITSTLTVGPGHAASGCDSGELTLEGMGVGAALAIGVVAMASASAWRVRDTQAAI
jgi:hypothetical protein